MSAVFSLEHHWLLEMWQPTADPCIQQKALGWAAYALRELQRLEQIQHDLRKVCSIEKLRI